MGAGLFPAAQPKLNEFDKVRLMSLHSGTRQVLLSLCSVHNDEEGGSRAPIVIRSILRVELELALTTTYDFSCGLSSAGRPDPEPQMAKAGRAGRSGLTHQTATSSPPGRQSGI